MERDEDIDDGNENETIYQASGQSKKLNDLGRRAVYEMLLKSDDGKLKKGALEIVDSHFSVS